MIRRKGDHKTTAMLEKDKEQQTCERLTVDLFLFQEKKRGKERDGEGTGLRQVGGREPARMTLSLLAHKTAHAVVQTLVATPTATPIHTARLWAVDLVSVVQVRFGRLRLSSPAVLVFPRLAIATKKTGVGTAGRLPFVIIIRGKEHPTKGREQGGPCFLIRAARLGHAVAMGPLPTASG